MLSWGEILMLFLMEAGDLASWLSQYQSHVWILPTDEGFSFSYASFIPWR